MPFYAQIDSNNLCIAVSNLRDIEQQSHLIQVPSQDQSFLGKTWVSDTEEWIDNSNYLYVHIQMSGDGREPIGIINNNTDVLTINVVFRTTDSSTSSIIDSVTGISWRVTIRDKNLEIYDIIDVPFTNGISTILYKTDNKPNICQLLESDLEKIILNDIQYTLKIIGDTTFKVYRQL